MEVNMNENDQISTSVHQGKYLTFSLEDEEYGIAIIKIKEITQMLNITPVPHTPHYVKGVVNLRGKVIPVMDLRIRFNMPEIEYSDRTCIIVVEIYADEELIQVGNVVDSVNEVLNVTEENIDEPPTFGTKVDTEFILGLANIEGNVKILLDIDMVANINALQGLD
ncbi:MAG: Chemotaxis protein cheW [Candidatus Magnetoglobus multicellularis str. Araruama]|uniref:Chemotaxis protein CheW n=1 Tax=Candidatus Magnetoglobus multicellularis str. Araruama TaxID=890399 RepID=A0A1V1P978_9BACT|nr:MAG: Chemotaxis protein cheW [Candidatus Magnetoglobus multicellularis str. Araruama]